MKKLTKNDGLMIGAGFLIGTLGIKALTSQPARNCYVQGVAQGLRVKSAYQDVVEEAKAQVDDIVAEANYINVEAEKEAAKPAEKKPASRAKASK